MKHQTGPIELDDEYKQVYVNGKRVHFSPKQFDVLHALFINKGRPLHSNDFMDFLYKEHQPEPKIIDVFICHVRKKLRKATGEDYIQTVWGKGYMLK